MSQSTNLLLARVAAWVMVAGTIYLYYAEAFGPMAVLAAGTVAMFLVEFGLGRRIVTTEPDTVVKYARMALAFFVVAFAGLVAFLFVR